MMPIKLISNYRLIIDASLLCLLAIEVRLLNMNMIGVSGGRQSLYTGRPRGLKPLT